MGAVLQVQRQGWSQLAASSQAVVSSVMLSTPRLGEKPAGVTPSSLGKSTIVKEQVTALPCHWLTSLHAGAPAQCLETLISP